MPTQKPHLAVFFKDQCVRFAIGDLDDSGGLVSGLFVDIERSEFEPILDALIEWNNGNIDRWISNQERDSE